MTSRARMAVIGSGVSGLTAAYLLQRKYDVVLFESDARLGGHSHTHDVPTPDGRFAAVDSGFIVHNDRTYPNLRKLFGELEVSTKDSEMSMSIRCEGCGLEYAGARGLGGLFAQPRNVGRPKYLRMLGEILRFYRHTNRVLAGELDDVTIGGFLTIGGYSKYFIEHFLTPVISCVWSAGPEVSLRYPARYLFEFLRNHGMLAVSGSPQWKTVVGGSRSYVERAVKGLSAVEVSTPVRSLHRHSDGFELRDDADTVHRADAVVVATHADTALGILANPTDAERRLLGAFEYSKNETWLHSDTSLLPASKGARASWNYLKRRCADSAGQQVLVSYHMNRLMRLDEQADYLVTLNADDRVAESAVIEKMVYEHPIYTPESVAASRQLAELNTGGIAYAGAYQGWGFHEDGCVSGVRAAAAHGVSW